METSDPRAGGFCKDQGPEAGYVSRATERSQARIGVFTGDGGNRAKRPDHTGPCRSWQNVRVYFQ